MADETTPRKLTRRDLIGRGAAFTFVVAGGAALGRLGGAGNASAAHSAGGVALPPSHPSAAYWRIAATDGHIQLPGRGPLYVFGFNAVEPLGFEPDGKPIYPSFATVIEENKGLVRHPAPLIGVDQYADVYLTVSNLGFVVRPDLDDSHTVHWHGFPNQSAIFDGVPEVSIAVPAGRSFPYFYRVRREGTFMYHCHFEDTEHVQMGMDGIIYVRPAQNGTPLGGFTKFVYNDGDGSTGYDREFALLFNEIWSLAHDHSESIQENVWTDYKPDYWVINGRCYPDTIKLNNDSSLPEQPASSLMQVNPGERVLIRMVNLGYEQDPIELPGLELMVVGEDATLLRGPGGADLSYKTRVVYIGPGEARDVLFTAPSYSASAPGGTDDWGPYNRYVMRNRNYYALTNGGAAGLGGQVTEVRVYDPSGPNGAIPDNGAPNQTYPEAA